MTTTHERSFHAAMSAPTVMTMTVFMTDREGTMPSMKYSSIITKTIVRRLRKPNQPDNQRK